jgi:hypothetical protein
MELPAPSVRRCSPSAGLSGLELWGTARGEHAAQFRELGATPIDYRREDFTRVLPGGFDVVFDGIAENGYRRSFAALKRAGLLCAYGYSAGGAGTASHAHDVDVDRAPVSLEMVARRQACWVLLDQPDAGAASRLVPGGSGAALQSIGNRRHPPARRRAHLL